jgi:hypothetical protein
MRSGKVIRDADGSIVLERVYVPETAPERMRGLLGRSEPGPDEGMWLQDCRVVHTIGMRFPIDLAYVDGAGRIRKLVHGLRPWRVSACLTARSVIELKSGAANSLGLARSTVLRLVERPEHSTAPGA